MSPSYETTIRVLPDKKTHFPLIDIPDIGTLTLWPVTKIQFEMFMIQTKAYGDTWYDEVLQCNPRISYHRVTKMNYERLFITGVYPDEVLSFSKWFGDGYRIPTVNEWRKAYTSLSSLNGELEMPEDLSEPAETIWKKIHGFPETSLSLTKFSLMQWGTVEWVMKNEEEFAGIGHPRHEFKCNCSNPLTDLVEKIKKNTTYPRKGYRHCGFRLIKGNCHDE